MGAITGPVLVDQPDPSAVAGPPRFLGPGCGRGALLPTGPGLECAARLGELETRRRPGGAARQPELDLVRSAGLPQRTGRAVARLLVYRLGGGDDRLPAHWNAE